MANSKLLKESIADAKAVKETALANAKIALEEAFTPRLQSILSAKLRAEAEAEDKEAEKAGNERIQIPQNASSANLLNFSKKEDASSISGYIQKPIDKTKLLALLASTATEVIEQQELKVR